MNFQNDFQKDFTAKKSLGQNFLHAPQAISAMIHAANISKESIVLEIGPGKGALTSKLLETGAKVVAIEKDDRAIPFLQEKFSEEIKSDQLEIIHGDVLEFDEINNEKLKTGYTIIANIPYYITGEFMRKFLESRHQPQKMVVMVQKEVAKRIVDQKESILSISVKVYGNPKYILSVPRKFFRPMPNVDSAILLIDNISKDFFEKNDDLPKIDEKIFFEVVKSGFAHKRKVVLRNLEDKIPKNKLEEIWETEKFEKTLRAEEISLKMWKKIVGNSGLF